MIREKLGGEAGVQNVRGGGYKNAVNRLNGAHRRKQFYARFAGEEYSEVRNLLTFKRLHPWGRYGSLRIPEPENGRCERRQERRTRNSRWGEAGNVTNGGDYNLKKGVTSPKRPSMARKKEMRSGRREGAKRRRSPFG